MRLEARSTLASHPGGSGPGSAPDDGSVLGGEGLPVSPEAGADTEGVEEVTVVVEWGVSKLRPSKSASKPGCGGWAAAEATFVSEGLEGESAEAIEQEEWEGVRQEGATREDR
eukprot:1133533-Pelagomonas_calceolata.AAC.5